MDPSLLLETFRRDGIAVLDGVLTGDALRGFQEQVATELTDPCIPPESGTPCGVKISTAASWPQGSQRRVIEVVPPGVGDHWQVLRQSPTLTETLDVLLGNDAWELPSNQPHGGRCEIRHWYCPVVFPEESALEASGKSTSSSFRKSKHDWRRGDVGKDGDAWSPSEDATLHELNEQGFSWEQIAIEIGNGRTPKHCRERYQPLWTKAHDSVLTQLCTVHPGSWQVITNKMQPARACTKRQVRERFAVLSEAPGGDSHEDIDVKNDSNSKNSTPQKDPSNSWHPVNRRRVLGKGWHVDIGPGFCTDKCRTLTGDPKQGVVVLVLLSDWNAGGGGTAFIRGSHLWVSEFLKQKHPHGVTHQELNTWVIKTVSDGMKGERLPLAYAVEGGGAMGVGMGKCPESNRLGIIDQITGRAGSVALLHPWLVHTGTTNLSSVPRVMANGMVQVKQSVFDKDGGCRVLFGLPVPEDNPITVPNEASPEKSPDSLPPKRPRVEAAVDTKDTELKEPMKDTRSSKFSLERAQSVASEMGLRSAHAARSEPLDQNLPSVSIIVPAHNASVWLDECFASVLAQSYCGPMEVSVFDDASSDDTHVIMKAWEEVFSAMGVDVKMNGSAWGVEGMDGGDTENSKIKIKPGGIGYGKNQAVKQSTAPILLFLDADDIMTPERVKAQVTLLLSDKNKNSIIGGTWIRYPAGSTEHYENWANTLPDPIGLWLEQFRETTVQMPTWCMTRDVYDAVGQFNEVLPNQGEGEDLIFFHKHLDAYFERKVDENGGGVLPSLEQLMDDAPLRRAGRQQDPLLLYRWSPASGTSRVSRQRLLEIRCDAFQGRILSQTSWGSFIVWGAGRDAKAFVNQLTPTNRKKIVAMLDVDEKKCNRNYSNHRWGSSIKDAHGKKKIQQIPVVFYSTHASTERSRMEICEKENETFRPIPIVVCVAKRRKGPGEVGDLERNVGTIVGLKEGDSLWFFM